MSRANRDSTRDTTDATTWLVASLLLGYPDDQLIGSTDVLRATVAELPATAGRPLATVLDQLAGMPLGEQQRRYVATFDLRKKCCLYLTWWMHGDTRNRGFALLQFKTAYRRAGVTPPDEELPDHLAVVLEFAAQVDPVAGRELLVGHRAALELIRTALREIEPVYALVLDAVCSTLPDAPVDAIATAQRIASTGPPTELVGLEPYTGVSR